MLEKDIFAALTGLFNGRVYPDMGPQDLSKPYCIFQRVGGVPSFTFCGNTDGQNARIQFWVWAKTREESTALLQQVEAVVTQAPFRAVSQGSQISQYDAPTKLYGAFQDFSFWYR